MFDECKHGLELVTCSICRNAEKPGVYITSGGIRYHKTPNCEALRKGQEEVIARGGTPDAVRVAHLGSSDLDSRDPCKTCMP
jgi:hypothetical protein